MAGCGAAHERTPVSRCIKHFWFPTCSSDASLFSQLLLHLSVIDCGSSAVLQRANLVKALYDFTAEEDDELSFCAGDVIDVLDCSDASWWKGRLRGNSGLFPANYTTQL